MGAPFEGDTAGRGLLDPMPDWVAEQIDIDDYVDYLKPPVGTWDGETYRISIDGDTTRSPTARTTTDRLPRTGPRRPPEWSRPPHGRRSRRQAKFRRARRTR